MFRGLSIKLKHEAMNVWRDPGTRSVLVFPIIAFVLFGYAVGVDVKFVSTVILDLNQDAESRQLIKEFENTGYFKLAGEVGSEEVLRAAIVSGRAKVGIKIPTDYSANLLNGRQGQVQVVIDGSDSSTALQILNSSQQLGFLKSLEREGVSPAMFSIDVRPHVLFNPSLRSGYFFIPGLIGIILQLAMVFPAVVACSSEGSATNGVLRSRAMAGREMIGAALRYVAVGFGQAVLMVLVMVLLFGVPIQGSVPLLLLLSLVFLVSAFGVGTFIRTLSRAQEYRLAMTLLFFLAVVLASGFVFPRESMPPAIYYLCLLIPATHYLEILRGIILRGAGIAALWDEALALIVLGTFLLALSVLRLKKRSG
jgi:ABC-type multidrug transport system permease subunit